MNNFFAIYSYELKKILSKRVFQVMFVLSLVLMVIVSVFDSDLSHSHITLNGSISASDFNKITKEKSRDISGCRIDDKLLGEMRNDILTEATKDGYVTWDDINAFLYDRTTEHFVQLPNGERCTVGTALSYAANKTGWYELFTYVLYNTGYEQAVLLAKSDEINAPLTFYYTPAYDAIADTLFMFAWMLFILLAACLSGTFADERSLGTNDLIRSSKNGMKNICFHKLLAGLTVSLLTTVIYLVVSFLVCGLIFGFDGADAPIQSIVMECPYDITVKQGAFITLGIMMLASTVFATGTMLLSEFIGSTQALSVRAVIFILSLFNIPLKSVEKYWELRPSAVLNISMFADDTIYNFAGKELDYLQSGVFVMVLLLVLYSVVTIVHYRKTI